MKQLDGTSCAVKKNYGSNELLSASALSSLLFTWCFPSGEVHRKIHVLGNFIMSSKKIGKMTLWPMLIKDAPTGQKQYWAEEILMKWGKLTTLLVVLKDKGKKLLHGDSVKKICGFIPIYTFCLWYVYRFCHKWIF
jgi:hypothetical protein